MCGGPEHFRPPVARNSGSVAVVEKDPNNLTLDHLHLQDQSPHISLLELAADNDIQAFKKALEQGCSVEKMEGWYGRKIGSNQMSVEERTPLMVACSYGSLEIVTCVLSLPNFKGLVNQASKSDHVTALHCAAAGGAPAALEIIKLLLENGADPNVQDSDGQKPITVIQFSPLLPQMKNTLRDLLNDFDHGCPIFLDQTSEQEHLKGEENPYEEFVSGYNMMPVLSSTTSPLSTSPDSCAWSSPLFSPSSPKEELLVQKSQTQEVAPEILSVPDIKNTIYSTDEFRMFSFKIRPCSRAYSHDWTECPFVHPGENARRRDPRRYHYSCVPCPDFRKGACRRGDACEYAHGVFECWLHPAQYRTRLCKDGTGCGRRVCFFAHTAEELRPLYVSVSSAMSSPRLASSAVDSRPGSPPLQSTFMGSAFPSSSATTPPLSPSACMTGSWSQPSIPPLHLCNTSRLKAALSARDIADEQQEYDGYLVEDFSPIPSHGRSAVMGSAVMGSSAARIAKYGNLGLCIPPTNLQELFASEVMSPMHLSPQEHSQITSQLQHCQFQSQLQQPRSSIHSPLQNSSQSAIQTQSALFHNISSPRPSPNRLSEMERQRPSNITSDIGLDNVRKAALMQRERGTWSPRDLNCALSPTWSDWGSPSGKPDWGVQGTDLNKFRKSASFAHGGMEPDLSWVQKLVKEVPSDANSSLTHSMASNESKETVNRFLMV